MTIKLTEEDVRVIYKALGFLDAALLITSNDIVQDASATYIDRLIEILDNALTDE